MLYYSFIHKYSAQIEKTLQHFYFQLEIQSWIWYGQKDIFARVDVTIGGPVIFHQKRNLYAQKTKF